MGVFQGEDPGVVRAPKAITARGGGWRGRPAGSADARETSKRRGGGGAGAGPRRSRVRSAGRGGVESLAYVQAATRVAPHSVAAAVELLGQVQEEPVGMRRPIRMLMCRAVKSWLRTSSCSIVRVRVDSGAVGMAVPGRWARSPPGRAAWSAPCSAGPCRCHGGLGRNRAGGRRGWGAGAASEEGRHGHCSAGGEADPVVRGAFAEGRWRGPGLDRDEPGVFQSAQCVEVYGTPAAVNVIASLTPADHDVPSGGGVKGSPLGEGQGIGPGSRRCGPAAVDLGGYGAR